MAVTKLVLRTDDVTGASDDTVEAYSFKLPVFDDETQTLSTQSYSLDASEETRQRIADATAKAQAAYARAMAKALKFATDAAKVKEVRGTNKVSDGKAVREWARQNGFTVSERGRLPENVMEAYLSAHPVTDSAESDAA